MCSRCSTCRRSLRATSLYRLDMQGFSDEGGFTFVRTFCQYPRITLMRRLEYRIAAPSSNTAARSIVSPYTTCAVVLAGQDPPPPDGLPNA